MVYPYAPMPRPDVPAGDTYAAALVHAGDPAQVTEVLGRLRFTGWVGAPDKGWLPIIAAGGTVAAGRRGIVEVGAELPGRVFAVRVHADRQLALVAWSGGQELGRYVSDPSREPGAADDVLDDPLGVEHAAAFAEVCGHPERAGELSGLLDERLDPETVNESERLAKVLRLLDLPTWLVAVATLPRDVPTGPRARELTRLGFGLPGVRGKALDRLSRPLRRRRQPPPVIADPPSGGGMDPWLL